MKLIRTSAIAIVAMLVSVFTFAQTAEEIVAKHIEAIGGAAAWKKVNSLYYEGKMTVQGAEINVTLTALNGKGVSAKHFCYGNDRLPDHYSHRRLEFYALPGTDNPGSNDSR